MKKNGLYQRHVSLQTQHKVTAIFGVSLTIWSNSNQIDTNSD